ncbi:GNAT family N-acetyltransferase [Falsiroseomonas ponticola]|uniref:GNAT family N-acetyltransferase n=1 Tax=Falsiroseomonas ponticola TaxID=2786951 RepID=UPI001931F483|nr:GNAT family N-acetyltransferase [Roseomonas ponticola]
MPAFRAATDADLPRAAALSARIGWNQLEADWRVFLDQGAVRVLDDGDADCLAASAATLPHGAGLAWVSMVLVRPDRRRQGLATQLMRWAIGEAPAPCLALDATPAGREVYRQLGFADLFGFARWSLPRALPAGTGIRPMEEVDWDWVLARDHAAFGAPRPALLRGLARRMPHAAFVTQDREGFVLARDGLRAPQIGPVVARGEAQAIALIAAAQAAIGAPVVIDLADAATRIAASITASGGERLRPFTRMARGAMPAANPEQNFVFAGPEFG